MHDRADELAAAVHDLGAAVRRRRAHLQLTQEEAAELAGVAVRTVHAAEAGKTTLRLDALLRVLSALGLELALQRGNAIGGLRVVVPDQR